MLNLYGFNEALMRDIGLSFLIDDIRNATLAVVVSSHKEAEEVLHNLFEYFYVDLQMDARADRRHLQLKLPQYESVIRVIVIGCKNDAYKIAGMQFCHIYLTGWTLSDLGESFHYLRSRMRSEHNQPKMVIR